MNIEEKIISEYNYYKEVCEDLELPELTENIIGKLSARLKNCVDDPQCQLDDLDWWYDGIFDDEIAEKLSQTVFAFDLIEIAINHMSVTRENYSRLLNILSDFDILPPYEILFTKFSHFMDAETKNHLTEKARSAFIEGVLDFLPDE